jgi:transcriptional regulator with XRE-family HTH domain
MNVGAELARARRSRGLSLEEMSKRTKIGIDDLEAIEANRIDDLPGGTAYSRVRTYAAEVQLDLDDVIDRNVAPQSPRIERVADSQSDIDAFPSEEETWGIDAFPSEETLLDTLGTSAVPSSPTKNVAPTMGHVAPPPLGESDDGTRDHSRTVPSDAPSARTSHPAYRSPARHWYGVTAVAWIAAAGGFLLAEYSHRLGLALPSSQVTSMRGNAPPEPNREQDAVPPRSGETTGGVVARGPEATWEYV